MTELKPCPECGDVSVVKIMVRDKGLFRYKVECQRPYCDCRCVVACSEEKAIEKWNRMSDRKMRYRWRTKNDSNLS